MSSLSSTQEINYQLIEESFKKEDVSPHDASMALLTLTREALQGIDADFDAAGVGADGEAAQEVLGRILDTVDQILSQPKGKTDEGILILFELINVLLNMEANEAKSSALNSQELSQLSLINTQVQDHSYKHIVHEITHRTWWQKLFAPIIKYVVPLIAVAALALTGHEGMAALVLGMAIAIDAGGLKKLSGSIQGSLKKDGASDGISKMLGGVFTTLIMGLATLGVGSIAAIEVTAEEGAEVVGDAVERASKEISFNMKRAFSMGAMGASATLATQSMNIANGFANSLGIDDSKTRKILGLVIGIVLALVGIVGAVYSGRIAIGSEVGGTSAVASEIEAFANEQVPSIVKWLGDNAMELRSKGRLLRDIGKFIGGVALLNVGTTDTIQSFKQEVLGKLEGAMLLLQEAQKMNSSEMSQSSNTLEYLSATFPSLLNPVEGLLWEPLAKEAQILAQ